MADAPARTLTNDTVKPHGRSAELVVLLHAFSLRASDMDQEHITWNVTCSLLLGTACVRTCDRSCRQADIFWSDEFSGKLPTGSDVRDNS